MSQTKFVELLERMPDTALAPKSPGEVAEATSIALAVIGYRPLRDLGNADQLRLVLREQRIRPYTRESVRRYQEAVRRETRASKRVRFWVGVFITAFLTLAGLVVAEIAFGDRVYTSALMTLTGVVVFVTFACMAVYGDTAERVAWHRYPLKNYWEPIPIAIANMIADLHARIPEAEFEVEALSNHPDPFLAISYGNMLYYIAVWNEPDFQAVPLD